MTIPELESLFDKHEDEFLKFDRIPHPLRRSNRPDMHLFQLLDEMFPDDQDIISDASHDEICLSIDGEKFAAGVTESRLVDMIRCGLRWDEEYQSLCMFV